MKHKEDQAIHPHTGDVAGSMESFGKAGNSTGVTDTYGADLSGDATNRMGAIAGACKGDPAFACHSHQSTKG